MTLAQYVRKGSFYKAVVEDGSDLIFVVDYDGNIAYHNASVKDTLGYRSRSLIGKNFFDYIHPSSLPELKVKFKHSQKRAYTEKVEFQFRSSKRTYRFLEFNAINLKHKEGIGGLILDCRDITERKRNAEELLRLQKAKEQFLANISHEIRTPINGIAGMADLLGHTTAAEERETYLNAIRHSAENLKVIINDILDLAAIESGKFRFERIAFNLTDLVPSLIGTFTYQAREKKLKLDYAIDERLNLILMGDPVRLNQILVNLINNAVKFTPKGAIEIRCDLYKKQRGSVLVRFSVRDTGIGIPAEKLKSIFESFSQADASFTRKYGGSGLGLTIVKQLVELQDGSIRVESKEDRGSLFTVIIPYGVGRSANFSQTKALPPTDRNFGRDLHILLVEDNDINRLYARSILKNWDCKVDTAENGLVAVKKVSNHAYDLVLMDVQMPVMDGYDATRAIRAMAAPRSVTPIIALTANATRADIEKCLSAGMNDYLSKPFTPDDLLRKIVRDLKLRPAKTETRTPSPPASAAPGTSNAYDLTYLKTISGNDEAFIRDMMQTFVDTMPAVIQQMAHAAQSNDLETLARLAHQIKPSFSLLGIQGLQATILFIEENGKQKTRPAEVHAATNEFVTSCNSLISDFSKALDA